MVFGLGCRLVRTRRVELEANSSRRTRSTVSSDKRAHGLARRCQRWAAIACTDRTNALMDRSIACWTPQRCGAEEGPGPWPRGLGPGSAWQRTARNGFVAGPLQKAGTVVAEPTS